MARKKSSGPGRRRGSSLRSGFMDRHRLRMRQLQARRARLRNALSRHTDGGEIEREPVPEGFSIKEIEEESC
ncbi:hypothetical protein Misp06_02275 [Microbulbifer sp. NBRC 101763]|uniref:hypothetical protein n=2 Tax=Microbulbifer TaxID=48073 RepID=UPI003097A6DF